jgi:hypothetical protein
MLQAGGRRGIRWRNRPDLLWITSRSVHRCTERGQDAVMTTSGNGTGDAPTTDFPPLTRRTEDTLGALVADASRDLSSLVRQEIALAKAELRVDVKNAATAGAMFGAAAFLGLLAVVMLSITLALFLAWLGLEAWLAFLIVTVFFLLVAAGLALVGKRKVSKVRPPERTIRTSKDTASFLKSRGR